jgi:O-antigen ligase
MKDKIPALAEQGALVGLAFFLPLYEAPKNILWLAFVVLWLANRVRAPHFPRGFGGRWDGWDTLLALWIASGFAAAAFAGLHGDEWRSAIDIVRYGGVLWLLKRSGYPARAWGALLGALLAGTVVTLAQGYWKLLVAGSTDVLTLNSVGHVNHSAVYMSIMLGVALMALRAYWSASGWALRALGAALVALFAVSVLWMQSRGAAGAAFVIALVLLFAYTARRRGSFHRLVIAAALVVGATLALKPQVLEKNTRMIEEGKFLNVRDGAWRVGLAAWREFPLFGVGMDNFGRIGPEEVQAWKAKRGEPFERDAYLFTSHGHSLYVNTLAERGLVGLAVLLAVLAAWAAALVRRLPQADASPLAWTFWGSASGAWIAAVLEGTVNTTLHHEHALLSMLLLGAWLSLSRPPSGPAA